MLVIPLELGYSAEIMHERGFEGHESRGIDDL